MSLFFKNAYTETVYIALLWFDATCHPDPWRKIGWYVATPGLSVRVVEGDLRFVANQNFGWWAVAGHADGPTWSGDHGYRVPHNVGFNQCYADDSNCNATRFFHTGLLSEEWQGLEILLIAPGSAQPFNQGCAWALPEFPPDPVGGGGGGGGGGGSGGGGGGGGGSTNTVSVVNNNVFTTTINVNTNNFNSTNIGPFSSPGFVDREAPIELVRQSIDYFASPLGDRKGRLMVVGCGIRAVSDMTLDAEAQIRSAGRVFYCVADPVTERRLHTLNASAESLYGLYGDDKPRVETYREMVEAILGPVREGADVCVVFYGHPGVFAWSTHQAIRIARREGYRAEMHAGISADASLFADLGIDPSQPGCHSLEATDFLAHNRTPDVRAHLLLWQVECVGDFGFRFSGYARHNFPILIEKLRTFYPANHPVVIYEAAQMPQGLPKIVMTSLDSIVKTDLTGISTLYLPPAVPLEVDREMGLRLGIL